MTAEAFLGALKTQAFDTLDIEGHEIDLQGWMCSSFQGVFREHVAASDSKTPLVIEVGSWKGKSAIAMASACETATVVAVDTWLGAPEFWTWGAGDPTRGGSLRFVDGFPTVFYTFTKNVKASGLHDRICPLPLSSVQAAEVLLHHQIAADIVYIDAAHEYGQVTADLEAYWPLVVSRGTMFGDDYGVWPGVARAVDEFARRQGVVVDVKGVVWSLRRA